MTHPSERRRLTARGQPILNATTWIYPIFTAGSRDNAQILRQYRGDMLKTGMKESSNETAALSHPPIDLLNGLLQFSTGWASLQWRCFNSYEVPGADHMSVWLDGSKPVSSQYTSVGEAGGCLYSICPGRSSTTVYIMKPLSNRTLRAFWDTRWVLHFRVRGVAIDLAQDLVVLLELNSSSARLHYRSLESGTERSSPFSWDSFWHPSVAVTQFEVIGHRIGIAVHESRTREPPMVPAERNVLFINWQLDLLYWPQKSGSTSATFQFLNGSRVLMIEVHPHGPCPARAFDLPDEIPEPKLLHFSFYDHDDPRREASLSKPPEYWLPDLYDPLNEEVFDLRIRQIARAESIRRITFIKNAALAYSSAYKMPDLPYMQNLFSSEESRDRFNGPFCADPKSCIVGYRCEYSEASGITVPSVALHRFESLLKKESRPSVVFALQEGESHALCGSKFIWLNRSIASGRRIFCRNLNPHATTSTPPAISVNPSMRNWVSETYITDNSPMNARRGLPPTSTRVGVRSFQAVLDLPYVASSIMQIVALEDNLVVIEKRHGKLFANVFSF